ncbi:receptor activity-modifying protein 2 [Synchiropus picturatus]
MTESSSSRFFSGCLMTLLILGQTAVVCLIDEKVAVQPTTITYSQSTEAMTEIINATYPEHTLPFDCGDNVPDCSGYCYACHYMYDAPTMECLQNLLRLCIHNFEASMGSHNSSDWCLWSKVSGVYSNLSHCTEMISDCLLIPWPNPLVEQTFVGIHSQYFADCPTEELIDPPPGIVFALVITPICLIPVMVSLVVLKTKNGDGSS